MWKHGIFCPECCGIPLLTIVDRDRWLHVDVRRRGITGCRRLRIRTLTLVRERGLWCYRLMRRLHREERERRVRTLLKLTNSRDPLSTWACEYDMKLFVSANLSRRNHRGKTQSQDMTRRWHSKIQAGILLMSTKAIHNSGSVLAMN